MNYYGYHRTSTKEQHLDRGILEISDFCHKQNFSIKKIYTDQLSGKTFDRPRYKVLKEEILHPGDVLIITEIDRLGRDKKSILKELEYFKEKEIRVMILELPSTLIDFSYLEDDMAKLFVEMITNMLIELYASLAQAEMHKKKKRQREGLEAKKLRGEWGEMGRPRKISLDRFGAYFDEVIDGAMKPNEVMRKLDLKKSTYYKYANEYLLLNGIERTIIFRKAEDDEKENQTNQCFF